MNTLHLTTMPLWDLGKGKGRVSTILPLKGFIERGHRVKFVTSSNIHKESEVVDGIEIEKIHIPFVNGRYAVVTRLLLPIITCFFILRTLKRCKGYKPQVIYAHAAQLALAARILAKIYKAKYVLRLYGTGKAYTHRLSPSSIIFAISMLIRADAYVLTNDGTNADKFAKSLGVPDSKIHFLRNGIDKSHANDDVDLMLKSRYAPNDEKLILVLGRLANWKKVDEILSMFSELVKINNSVKLLIVGDGPEMSNLKELSQTLNIDDRVIFVGAVKQKEVFKYCKISDVFLSMNSQTSLANTTFEAMLSSLTVVALDKGTTTEMIKDRVNGVVVTDTQLPKLPSIINKLLLNDSERVRIGESGREYILNNFTSWEERVNREVDIIEGLVDYAQ